MEDDVGALSQTWYAVVDDLIGGWCIANVDKPTSRHNHAAGEGEIASFMTEDVARYIVNLHNTVLAMAKESSDGG